LILKGPLLPWLGLIEPVNVGWLKFRPLRGRAKRSGPPVRTRESRINSGLEYIPLMEYIALDGLERRAHGRVH